jgi:hypothetical protein
MTLYNIMFEQNPKGDVILATLGLTRQDVGRFRDCFVADGKIAVYTRNGGGNRDCWHEDKGSGLERCKHASYLQEIDEVIYVPSDQVDDLLLKNPDWREGNIFMGGQQSMRTGKKVMNTFYDCLEPNSASCACPGCIIQYRLPKHPNYISSEDDDFDCTYATIYFSFPAEFAEQLKMLEAGEKFDPDARWIAAIEALKGMSK